MSFDLDEFAHHMGLGDPLLSVHIDRCTITIHRQETMTPQAESANRYGEVTKLGVLWEVANCVTDEATNTNNSSAGPLRAYGLTWRQVGENKRAIVGALAPGAATVEARAGEEPVSVTVGGGAFVVIGPISQTTWIIHRDASGKAVWRDRVGAGDKNHPTLGEWIHVYRMMAWILWKKLRGQPAPGR